MAKTPASRKARGRRAQQHVRDRVTEVLGLAPGDVESRSTGANGEDLLLSPTARERFPFSVEVKNQESLSVWSAYEQAAGNAKGHEPLLVIKRNRSKYLAVIELDAFLELVRKANGNTR